MTKELESAAQFQKDGIHDNMLWCILQVLAVILAICLFMVFRGYEVADAPHSAPKVDRSHNRVNPMDWVKP